MLEFNGNVDLSSAFADFRVKRWKAQIIFFSGFPSIIKSLIVNSFKGDYLPAWFVKHKHSASNPVLLFNRPPYV